MTASRFVRPLVLALCFLMMLSLSGVGFAQTKSNQSEYLPTEGQAGKDVIWLPTSQALVDTMLDLAKMTPQDYVIDLGSGDGRTVITAAKRGASAIGIEYNPDMVELSKRNAAKEGVSDRAQFVKADLFESDFSKATVVTMFLLPSINLELRPKILNLKPGTRIVSNSFDMREWEPDKTATVEDREKCSTYCTALLWIVPAKVEGAWKLAEGQLTLKQSFQMISGNLTSGSNNTSIKDGRLNGDQISFSVGNVQYTGKVNGNAMEGTFKSEGKTGSWNASRTGK